MSTLEIQPGMKRISEGPSPNTCQAMLTPSGSMKLVRGTSTRSGSTTSSQLPRTTTHRSGPPQGDSRVAPSAAVLRAGESKNGNPVRPVAWQEAVRGLGFGLRRRPWGGGRARVAGWRCSGPYPRRTVGGHRTCGCALAPLAGRSRSVGQRPEARFARSIHLQSRRPGLRRSAATRGEPRSGPRSRGLARPCARCGGREARPGARGGGGTRSGVRNPVAWTITSALVVLPSVKWTSFPSRRSIAGRMSMSPRRTARGKVSEIAMMSSPQRRVGRGRPWRRRPPVVSVQKPAIVRRRRLQGKTRSSVGLANQSIGKPASRRVIAHIGVRTATATLRACSAASPAISMPEVPSPTTTTSLSVKRSGVRYSAL